MSATAFEPVFAGAFEECLLDGVPAVAYPRARAACGVRLSFLAVVDGPTLALDPLALPAAEDVEVLVLDNASPAATECLRFAAAAPNRVVYRVPTRLPRAEAWRLLRSAARGVEVANAVPQTRGLALLARGAEAAVDPTIFAAWRDVFGPSADASLVLVVAPSGLDALVWASHAADAAGGEVGDLVAVVAPDVEAELERLAPLCVGLVTRRPHPGTAVTPERLAALAV